MKEERVQLVNCNIEAILTPMEDQAISIWLELDLPTDTGLTVTGRHGGFGALDIQSETGLDLAAE